MKYLKLFTESENTEEEPQVGDYIIAKLPIHYKFKTSDAEVFCHNNIGQIIGIIYDRLQNNPIYKVKYKNVPAGLKISQLNNNVRGFLKKNIELWNKDKEQLEAMIQANKYNL